MQNQIINEFFADITHDLAIITIKQPSGENLNESFKQALLDHSNEYNVNLIDEDCYEVDNLSDVPLIAQALSESYNFNGIIIVDFLDGTNTFQLSLLPSIISAVYDVELENGVKIHQVIQPKTPELQLASTQTQLAKDTLHAITSQIKQIMLIRFESTLDDEYAENEE